MRVNGTHTNKKQCLKMHYIQCKFFNEAPLSQLKIDKMSARDIYIRNKIQFDNQTRINKDRFIKFLQPKKAIIPWYKRLLYKVRSLFRKAVPIG